MRRTKTFFGRANQRLRIWVARRKLLQLDDRMLRDIGIPRSEIDHVVKTGLRRTQHFDF
jgi:uncharacterized protein YjiS (DUF1127 family)